MFVLQRFVPALVLACSACAAPAAPALDAKVTELMTKALPESPGPDDVHVVGRNASKTQPAKFLVMFVKQRGAPVLTVEAAP